MFLWPVRLLELSPLSTNLHKFNPWDLFLSWSIASNRLKIHAVYSTRSLLSVAGSPAIKYTLPEFHREANWLTFQKLPSLKQMLQSHLLPFFHLSFQLQTFPLTFDFIKESWTELVTKSLVEWQTSMHQNPSPSHKNTENPRSRVARWSKNKGKESKKSIYFHTTQKHAKILPAPPAPDAAKDLLRSALRDPSPASQRHPGRCKENFVRLKTRKYHLGICLSLSRVGKWKKMKSSWRAPRCFLLEGFPFEKIPSDDLSALSGAWYPKLWQRKCFVSSSSSIIQI